MITLRRLDLVRQDSQATAEELASLQTQLNSLLFTQVEAHLLTGAQQLPTPFGNAALETANGFIEFEFRGRHFVLPFYEKG